MRDFELDNFLNRVDMGDDDDLFVNRNDYDDSEDDCIREIDFR